MRLLMKRDMSQLRRMHDKIIFEKNIWFAFLIFDIQHYIEMERLNWSFHLLVLSDFISVFAAALFGAQCYLTATACPLTSDQIIVHLSCPSFSKSVLVNSSVSVIAPFCGWRWVRFWHRSVTVTFTSVRTLTSDPHPHPSFIPCPLPSSLPDRQF